MNEFSLYLPPDLMGVLDNLIDKIEYTETELMNLGLFLYHPDIFLQTSIEYVRMMLFLDESEQLWLSELCDYFGMSEEEMILELLLDTDLPLYQ